MKILVFLWSNWVPVLHHEQNLKKLHKYYNNLFRLLSYTTFLSDERKREIINLCKRVQIKITLQPYNSSACGLTPSNLPNLIPTTTPLLWHPRSQTKPSSYPQSPFSVVYRYFIYNQDMIVNTWPITSSRMYRTNKIFNPNNCRWEKWKKTRL